MSFDWQDGESNWSIEPAAEPSPRREPDAPPAETAASTAKPSRLSRRALWAGLGLILLVGLVAGAGWLAGRQVGDRERTLSDEINASYATLLDAGAKRDTELFSQFLSGSDPAWVAAQQTMAGRGLLLDRSVFGLQLVPPDGNPAPVITFSPDLLSAELTQPITYSIDVGNGLTETVTLEQTAVFRLGEDRWLYAPPEAEFWGEMVTDSGRYLRLTYPERDTAISRRLAREIDAKLVEYCARAPQFAGCPAGLQVDVVLSTDPATFNSSANPLAGRQINEPALLPTPTLVGLPTDEAAYRALYRGYAAQIVSGVVGELAGWRCCDADLFYRALLAAQLRQLGLRPWPLTPDDYARFAENPEELENVEALWRGNTIDSPPGNVWQLYVLVEFLTEEIGALPVLFMQRLLLNNPNQSYWAWLSLVTGDRFGSQEDFERDLLRFAASRAPERPLAAVAVRSQTTSSWPLPHSFSPL